jgi:hypothetical protein
MGRGALRSSGGDAEVCGLGTSPSSLSAVNNEEEGAAQERYLCPDSLAKEWGKKLSTTPMLVVTARRTRLMR